MAKKSKINPALDITKGKKKPVKIPKGGHLVTPPHGRGKIKQGGTIGPGSPTGPRLSTRIKNVYKALKAENILDPEDDQLKTLASAHNLDVMDVMIVAMFRKAASGDVQAFREIADRLEGKATQPVTGEGGGPMQLQIIGPEEGREELENV